MKEILHHLECIKLCIKWDKRPTDKIPSIRSISLCNDYKCVLSILVISLGGFWCRWQKRLWPQQRFTFWKHVELWLRKDGEPWWAMLDVTNRRCSLFSTVIEYTADVFVPFKCTSLVKFCEHVGAGFDIQIAVCCIERCLLRKLPT